MVCYTHQQLICFLNNLITNCVVYLGQKVYTAPNGVTVTSSAVTYKLGKYYHLGYLFNGDIKSPSALSYWLTHSSGNQTLTINFGDWINLESIHISAMPYKNADRRSDYSIEVFARNSNKWINVCGVIDTKYDPVGYIRSHSVRESIVQVRINLSRKEKYGVCLREIDLYVV